MPVRVATYNVHGLRRPLAVAGVIRSLRADVVLVQEFGVGSLLRVVARAAGMRSVARARLSRPFQRNAILLGREVAVLREWPMDLPSTPPRSSRGAMLAELLVGDGRLVVASVHLGLKDGERTAHAGMIAAELDRSGLPFVLGGDLNEGPEGPAAALLADRFTDAFGGSFRGRAQNEAHFERSGATYPAGRPTSRIDFLFVGGGATVAESAKVHGAVSRRASDHMPLVVDVGV